VKRLDLIDGAVVRQNPLPALFSWLRENEAVAAQLFGEGEHDAGIHLVYNVPTEPYDADPAKAAPDEVDVVTAASVSLELGKRRDTKLEARQTNFISELELRIRKACDGKGSPVRGNEHGAFPIFTDEIAPETEIAVDNNLDPSRDSILKIVASGCRRSLETLYRFRLKEMALGDEGVECVELLREVAPERRPFVTPEAPGLPEICRRCTRRLMHRPLHAGHPPAIRAEEFPNLEADRARVVFVASGGVFRGAFHIGAIGAMRAAGIRPNLVVGSSVGALMGGALSAISSVEATEGARLLADLCLTFLHVDRRVALTRTLKNATKQLGVRAVQIHLSPAKLRRAVRKGTRSDAGYAVCGAPPALIDALSSLFLIPHDDTRAIASQFVAGHITKAMTVFWSKVREETLKRLNIENSVMGTSLLETTARTLLGDGRGSIRLDKEQPYHDDANPRNSISFFVTTSDLNRRRALLLPRDVRSTGSYDFVKAGLSSSAFPVVFSPRQEAEVLPGRGATNVLFSDGGMFDNLPFFPALEILSSVQKHYREKQGQTACEALAVRANQPDLFVAAALETDTAPRGEADNVIEIWRRSRTLNTNVKLDSFDSTSQLVSNQIGRLLAACKDGSPDSDLDAFMDQTVQSAVLKIAPTNREHINGTFAFCSSLGLKQKRVMMSIADGCFQTLRSLQAAQTGPAESPLRKSTDHLRETGRLGHLTPNHNDKKSEKACPFYLVHGKEFVCPFVQAAEATPPRQTATRRELLAIYKTCVTDKDHTVAPKSEIHHSTGKHSRQAHNGRSGNNGTANKAATSVPRVNAP
jgi:predicted acylesterase/phospholipase RssA